MSHKQIIALAQVSPKLGDVQANLAIHEQYIEQAKAAKAELIVFPELGLTGYQTQDLTLEVARSIEHPDIQRLVQLSRDIDVLFSFVEETREHMFYVSALYASKGAVAHVHRKVYLPTYGMFDEKRYFAAGDSFNVVSRPTGDAGVLICEDAWHVSAPYVYAMQGATTLFVPASSPGRSVMSGNDFGSQTFWRQLLQMYAQLFGVHVVFVNRVGYEDGVHFYGGSGVVAPDGSWLVEAKVSEASLLVVSLDSNDVRRARYTTPLVRDERVDVAVKQLEAILRKR